MPLYVPNTPSTGTSNLVQTSILRLDADASTNSTTFVTLMSTNITTGDGFLILSFTCSCHATSNNRQISFDIQVDGVSQTGTAVHIQSSPSTGTAATQARMAIAAGVHTVTVRWRTSAGVAVVQPVTLSEIEHAALMMYEVLN